MVRKFIALLFLASCTSQPQYKVGDCFFWRYNPDFYGQIIEVDVKKKRYSYLNVKREVAYMRISSIDRNTDKIKCEKTSL